MCVESENTCVESNYYLKDEISKSIKKKCKCFKNITTKTRHEFPRLLWKSEGAVRMGICSN